jgi:hypothetical protein
MDKSRMDERAYKGVWWWGYLHQNGTIQLKRWFGDPKDYQDDCEGNDCVQKVVEPFECDTHEGAYTILKERLGVHEVSA